MEYVKFHHQKFGTTCFAIGDNQVTLKQLYGMTMYEAAKESPLRLQGITELCTDIGDMNQRNFRISRIEKMEQGLCIHYAGLDGQLKLKTTFVFDEKNGILSRQDMIENTGVKAIHLQRMQPKFLFDTGEYDCYVQNSTWCYEDQGGWEPVGRSGVNLENENGRTTQGSVPLLGIRSQKRGRGIAFHILPKGNWEMKLKKTSAGVGPQGSGIMELKLGHATRRFSRCLAPGEQVKMPQILIQSLPEGSFYTVSENLHRYLRREDKSLHRLTQKVVYNPWFDCYDHIDVKRMLERARLASELGCEIFEVDAGWYGQCSEWSASVGDWREKIDGAFYGRLVDFKEQIKQLGMQFGLWMEPERIAENAPMRLLHPEWFAYSSNGNYYPKLWVEEAYEYIKGEILRLIETYELAWMKIDFNFELEEDETKTELMIYYEKLYQLLDEIRELHPEMFLEGCASGGQRTDIQTMMHFDGHFLCDNVNPFDNLSMYEQLLIRTLPAKIYRWIVVQKGAVIPTYFRDESDEEATVIVPQAPGAGFGDYEKIDMEFLCQLVVQGMTGISGDITTLNQRDFETLKSYIGFYKKFRSFFQESVVSLDSEPTNIGERSHFRVLTFFAEATKEALIYVLRFQTISRTQTVYPKHLEPAADYTVQYRGTEEILTGKQLIEEGIEVELARPNSGEIIYIKEAH